MSKYDGLIIPRSYNDYFSRSDPAAIRKVVEVATDAELDATSTAPIQNKAVAELVPAAASTTNQLADKQFVNSTVGTNTAIFRGTFNSLAELEAYSGDKTNNDYAFVIATDTAGNTQYKRYKYNGSAWEYEYTLNNSSFTATQWAAIQSGITSELVAKIGDAGLVPITTGDYNELPEAEKNADKLYLLTDATNGFVAITDTVAAGSTAVPTSDAVNTALSNKVVFTKRSSGNLTNGVSIADLPDGIFLVAAQDLYHNASYYGAAILMKYSTTRSITNFATSTLSFSVDGDTLKATNSNLYLYHLTIIKLI